MVGADGTAVLTAPGVALPPTGVLLPAMLCAAAVGLSLHAGGGSPRRLTGMLAGPDRRAHRRAHRRVGVSATAAALAGAEGSGASARSAELVGWCLTRPRRWGPLLLLTMVLTVNVAGPAGPLTVAAGCGALLVVRGRARRARRLTERRRAAEACSVLASELRAGRSPAESLVEAAAVAAGQFRLALSAAASAASLGVDVADALLWHLAHAGRPASPLAALRGTGETAVPEVLRALAACWRVCSTHGAGLAAAIERLEEGLRVEEAQRRDLAAELAGPRATAVLLAGLPLVGIAMAAALGAKPVEVLLHTTAGGVCLVTGIGLDLLGLWWTGRLVHRAGGG